MLAPRSIPLGGRCSQSTPPTPGQADKSPVLIPIAVGLLGPDGADLPIRLRSPDARGSPFETTVVLRLSERESTFVLEGAGPGPVVPSVLRGFSAPVRLTFDQPEADLLFLLRHDGDAFNRFEAGQRLGRALLVGLLADYAAGRTLAMDPRYAEGVRGVLRDPRADRAFKARCLALPSESEVADLVEVADPDAIHAASAFAGRALAEALRPELEAAVAECDARGEAEVYRPDAEGKGRRALANAALGLLACTEDPVVLDACLARYRAADNMTDMVGCLAALASRPGTQRGVALAEFADRFKGEPLVMLKWLGLQAMSNLPGNVEAVRELTGHPAFDFTNPNKNYSLLGGCARAPSRAFSITIALEKEMCLSSVFFFSFLSLSLSPLSRDLHVPPTRPTWPARFANGSPVNFHAADGSGYAFFSSMVIKLDGINPQVAARLVSAFTRWRRYDAARQALMRAELERIAAVKGLSANVFEIASKALAA